MVRDMVVAARLGRFEKIDDPERVQALLGSTRQPWLFETTPDVAEAMPGAPWIHELNSASCGTVEQFYHWAAAGFRFPDYFGRNLDALLDCLRDIRYSEIGAQAIVIRNADRLLWDESPDLAGAVLETLGDAAAFMNSEEPDLAGDGPPTPFHVALVN